MKQEELVLKFLQCEQEFPVYDWTLGDLHLWPLFKEITFFTLLEPKSQIRKTPISCVQKKLQVLLDIPYYLKNRNFQKVNAIFLGSKAHRSTINDQFINKFFHAIRKDYTTTLMIDYGGMVKHQDYGEDVLDFNRYYKLPLLLSRLKKNKRALYLPCYDLVVESFGSIEKEVFLRLKNQLVADANNILIFAELFIDIFKKTQPSEVFSLCYYSGASYAFHFAANSMGIPNYEIQHGGLGDQHPMYTYDKYPVNGQNIMPQNFWVWDEAVKNHFNTWLPATGFHKVINKGNPWLNYVIENEKSILAEERKIILYTMQLNTLDQYIIDAVKGTPDDFKWYLRMHPRFTAERKYLEDQLSNAGILYKVEIENATDLPLGQLLQQCMLHISKFSGSIIEAVYLNKKTIILEEIGTKQYGHYIKQGKCTGLTNPTSQEIIDVIIQL